MKNLKYLQKFFFLLVMGISLSFICACGDDEEEPVQEPEKEKSLGIIGTWMYQFSTGYVYIYFDKAGYGWAHEYDETDGGWYEKEHFTYVYDDTAKKIIFKWSDGGTEAIIVSALSETKLVLEEYDDGRLSFYERVSDGEHKTGNEKVEPEPNKEKKLVKIQREKAKRYEHDKNSPLEKYKYIYEFNYNDEGFLSNARCYSEYGDGYSDTEVINYTYWNNEICNEDITYSLFDNGKVSTYDRYGSHQLYYDFSNSEQLIGIDSDYIITWEDNTITKVGENSYYNLPFKTYDWYNIYEYDGKSCNGFIDIEILDIASILDFDGGKVMCSIIALVHPELFGLRINQLPKSSKEINVDYYDEETGKEYIDEYYSYTYAYTYEFDNDGYLKKVTKTLSDTGEYITSTYTWE